MSHNTTFEDIQSQYNGSLKMPQSEFDTLSEDGDSVQPRQGKTSRRESILGLRNIFTRSNRKDGEPSSISRPSRSAGLRASIAEMSHWPYGQQARSEVVLSSLPTTLESPQEQVEKSPHPVSRRRKAGAVTVYSMPPLFKAYPQAVRHGTLPAPAISADILLRLSEKKFLMPADPMASIEMTGEHQASDMERLKRRLRGDSLITSSLQWTTKTYVLLTSGYLLQYSGDGNPDRLPEKVLRLGHSSAAFASDLIPGRHWVLHVSSTTDHEGTLQPEPKSLFSKLQFRIPDKRATSNLLMVFESAEDMKEWMAVLRNEIEKLGSGKNVSVTGGGLGDEDETDLTLRELSSRRTIIPRSSGSTSQSRCGGLVEEKGEEGQLDRDGCEREREPRTSNCSTAATDCDNSMQDSSLDNVSITNSVISHDGRQLDSLRENSNRFSYLSSGQRTVMTSTSSSPATSPVLERFPRPMDADPDAIPSRRLSLHAISASVEEACPAIQIVSGDAVNQGSINLNAPPLRRISYAKAPPTASSECETSSPTTLKGGLSLFPRSSLRKQLATIRTGRPLSTVEDQPSPKENMPERPITSHHAGSRSSSPSDAPPLPRGGPIPVSTFPSCGSKTAKSPERRPSLMPGLPFSKSTAQSGPRPRRLSSFSGLRSQAETTGLSLKGDEATRRPQSNRAHMVIPPLTMPQYDLISNWQSSTESMHFAQAPTGLSRAAKRASTGSTYSDRSFHGDVYGTPSLELPPMLAPPPSKALPPIPQRPSTSGRGRLMKKASMSQLAEGPPPAPPPTCALPPIPQKLA